VEATLEVVSNFSNIRHIHILVLFVVFCEFEVHLLREEIFKEKVHQFSVFFLLEVIVGEHGDTSTNNQLPA
jgi:hypothetical protein